MAVEVIMPKLGMTMTEGTVVEWLKKENEPVKKGEPIAEISSEKLQNQVESPADGVLLKIVVQEDETVPVMKTIAYVGEPGEKIEQAVQPKEKEVESAPSNEDFPQERVQQAVRKKRIIISPAARKLARKLNVDIETVKGTGPNGRITNEDIKRAAEKKDMQIEIRPEAKPADAKVDIKKLAGMRRVIAERMHQSLQNSAQLTLMLKADVTELIALQKKIRSQMNDSDNIRITVTDLIAKATVKALLDHPIMNSTMANDAIYIHKEVHLGIAVALEEGLVVPVVRNAEKLSLGEISRQIRDLSVRAREGKLDMEEMKGSTFSITNLGRSGIEYFTPVLNTPESGILGVGSIQSTPVFGEDGQITRREMLPLSLTFDHRVLDGAPAGEFLSTVKNYLEHPYSFII